MNKKGFTLIELIAVVVIMAIIALIATPNIVRMIDKGKKSDYISDVNEFISKATYLYKQEKYREHEEYFNGGNTISLDKLDIKEEDKVDPYGYEYDLANSTITFNNPTSGLAEREVTVNIKSCGTKNGLNTCNEIVNVKKSELDEADVKTTNP